MADTAGMGRVHSIETFGSVDGPGVRFVIFLMGCHLRCRYCHNVDTWSADGGTAMTADELLDKAERYRSYWGKDGGITVSGGEPLLQIDFLTELFEKAKARGIGTCIDTAGEPFSEDPVFLEKFDRLLAVTDLLLVDIKHIDPGRHRWLTGKPNGNILAMLRYLSGRGKPVWIRQVLVPGITDGEEDLRKTAEFLRSLKNVRKIEVLPYHNMAVPKWEKAGIPYTLRDVRVPTAEEAEKAQRILRGEG
ncbi:pyruvate formate-lyase-activating protein [Clostridium vitabionis]|jgi:pyruvate formate lyase activating enzyme|uniref:pyruvate formate-lyase-activating protein n=1 Tax=Clostridium vitabionis TaxID=2784388 RepID=UPI00188DC63D|nr:pyruvate formate-lyase-activating protein [Clostridium vitabionis]